MTRRKERAAAQPQAPRREMPPRTESSLFRRTGVADIPEAQSQWVPSRPVGDAGGGNSYNNMYLDADNGFRDIARVTSIGESTVTKEPGGKSATLEVSKDLAGGTPLYPTTPLCMFDDGGGGGGGGSATVPRYTTSAKANPMPAAPAAVANISDIAVPAGAVGGIPVSPGQSGRLTPGGTGGGHIQHVVSIMVDASEALQKGSEAASDTTGSFNHAQGQSRYTPPPQPQQVQQGRGATGASSQRDAPPSQTLSRPASNTGGAVDHDQDLYHEASRGGSIAPVAGAAGAAAAGAGKRVGHPTPPESSFAGHNPAALLSGRDRSAVAREIALLDKSGMYGSYTESLELTDNLVDHRLLATAVISGGSQTSDSGGTHPVVGAVRASTGQTLPPNASATSGTSGPPPPATARAAASSSGVDGAGVNADASGATAGAAAVDLHQEALDMEMEVADDTTSFGGHDEMEMPAHGQVSDATQPVAHVHARAPQPQGSGQSWGPAPAVGGDDGGDDDRNDDGDREHDALGDTAASTPSPSQPPLPGAGDGGYQFPIAADPDATVIRTPPHEGIRVGPEGGGADAHAAVRMDINERRGKCMMMDEDDFVAAAAGASTGSGGGGGSGGAPGATAGSAASLVHAHAPAHPHDAHSSRASLPSASQGVLHAVLSLGSIAYAETAGSSSAVGVTSAAAAPNEAAAAAHAAVEVEEDVAGDAGADGGDADADDGDADSGSLDHPSAPHMRFDAGASAVTMVRGDASGAAAWGGGQGHHGNDDGYEHRYADRQGHDPASDLPPPRRENTMPMPRAGGGASRAGAPAVSHRPTGAVTAAMITSHASTASMVSWNSAHSEALRAADPSPAALAGGVYRTTHTASGGDNDAHALVLLEWEQQQLLQQQQRPQSASPGVGAASITSPLTPGVTTASTAATDDGAGVGWGVASTLGNASPQTTFSDALLGVGAAGSLATVRRVGSGEMNHGMGGGGPLFPQRLAGSPAPGLTLPGALGVEDTNNDVNDAAIRDIERSRRAIIAEAVAVEWPLPAAGASPAPPLPMPLKKKSTPQAPPPVPPPQRHDPGAVASSSPSLPTATPRDAADIARALRSALAAGGGGARVAAVQGALHDVVSRDHWRAVEAAYTAGQQQLGGGGLPHALAAGVGPAGLARCDVILRRCGVDLVAAESTDDDGGGGGGGDARNHAREPPPHSPHSNSLDVFMTAGAASRTPPSATHSTLPYTLASDETGEAEGSDTRDDANIAAVVLGCLRALEAATEGQQHPPAGRDALVGELYAMLARVDSAAVWRAVARAAGSGSDLNHLHTGAPAHGHRDDDALLHRLRGVLTTSELALCEGVLRTAGVEMRPDAAARPRPGYEHQHRGVTDGVEVGLSIPTPVPSPASPPAEVGGRTMGAVPIPRPAASELHGLYMLGQAARARHVAAAAFDARRGVAEKPANTRREDDTTHGGAPAAAPTASTIATPPPPAKERIRWTMTPPSARGLWGPSGASDAHQGGGGRTDAAVAPPPALDGGAAPSVVGIGLDIAADAAELVVGQDSSAPRLFLADAFAPGADGGGSQRDAYDTFQTTWAARACPTPCMCRRCLREECARLAGLAR